MEVTVKIENRQQGLVVGVAVIAALFVANQLIINPLTSLWKARAGKIVALHRQIDRGTAVLNREGVTRSRWTHMQTNTLPVNSSQAEQQILKAFDSWAQKSRVTITSITPQWKRDADEYMTLDCRVDASGDMQTLTQFLYDIENDPMALKLESVELSSHDNAGQQLTLGLQVSGLVLAAASQ